MLRKLLATTFLLTFILAADLNAQVDTTSRFYDFENLLNGNINGQNGWSSTAYNVTDDWKVIDTLSSHPSKLIMFNRSGSGVRADLSRVLDTVVFDKSNSMYILEFDIKRNYWGLTIGFGADLNNDGKTVLADNNEKAFMFTAGSLNGEFMTLPNSTTLSLGNNLGNAWQTIQIIIRPFNGFVGTFTVGKKPVGGQTYTNMVFNSNLFVDTASQAKYNISLWNILYLHAQGAGSYFDNIRLTKITNTTTGIHEASADYITAYYYDYQLFLDKKIGGNKPFEVNIYDASGREAMKFTQETTGAVSVTGLNKGWYCANIRCGNEVKRLPFYAE